jgi:hypothetical protein
MAVVMSNKVPSPKHKAQSVHRRSWNRTILKRFSTASSNKARVRELGMMFAKVSMQDKVSGGQGMKRLLALILVLTLLVITGTLVSADGKTSITNNEFKSRQLYRTNGG